MIVLVVLNVMSLLVRVGSGVGLCWLGLMVVVVSLIMICLVVWLLCVICWDGRCGVGVMVRGGCLRRSCWVRCVIVSVLMKRLGCWLSWRM